MINYYQSTHEDLLNKTGKPNMKLRGTMSFCIEIYKTLNKLNSESMKGLLRLCVTNRVQR